MKKSILFMALAATVAFTSCSKDDDGGDELTCEKAQANLEALGEDADCSATVKALEDTKKACGDSDGQIQAGIDIIKAFCN